MVITRWLPVLIIPLVTPVHGSVATTFAIIDYAVWALFAFEYLIKFGLAPNRNTSPNAHPGPAHRSRPFFSRHAWDGWLTSAGWVEWACNRDILDRAKRIMTHKGLHSVLLAVAVIVFASAGLVTIAER